MERIAVDIMGPLPVTNHGNRYLLVAMDYFTKWPEAYAVPDQEAKTVATVLVREFICRFGTPLELHSDQGRNFESELIKEICEILGINKTRTTPYHPQSDGMVERYNRTLATQLSMFVNENHSDWDEHLHTVLMAYRTAVHESTGQMPARLMMGHELRIPVDLMYGQPPECENNYRSKFAKQLTESLELTHQFARNRLRLSSERMKSRKFALK
jgi:transposase InsO family protein